jgi:Ca2+-binding EF-hand superfamily protein
MTSFAESGDEEKLMAMFNVMDIDGNGYVDSYELRRVLLGFAGNDSNAVSDEDVSSWLI